MKRPTILHLAAACIIAVAAGLCCWSIQRGTPPGPTGGSGTGTARQQPETPENARDGTGTPIEMVTRTVSIVVSKDPVGIIARKQAVKNLSRTLESPDLSALMRFISGEKPEACRLAHWHGLVDDIINVLRRQNEAPKGLTPTLVHIYMESNDVVLQDYAIQYLRSCYVDRGDFLVHEANPDAQDLILETLLHAASETGQTYSGTAMLALHAADTSSELQMEPATRRQVQNRLRDLGALILAAARDPQTNKHCRISALQLCAIRGLRDVLPTARVLAADKAADTNLRISAIAVLGQLGSPEQDEDLLRILENEGRRLAFAAIPAREKLSK